MPDQHAESNFPGSAFRDLRDQIAAMTEDEKIAAFHRDDTCPVCSAPWGLRRDRGTCCECPDVCHCGTGFHDTDLPVIAFARTEDELLPHMLAVHTDPAPEYQAHTESLTQDQLAAAHHQDHSIHGDAQFAHRH